MVAGCEWRLHMRAAKKGGGVGCVTVVRVRSTWARGRMPDSDVAIIDSE